MLENDINSYTENTRTMVGNISCSMCLTIISLLVHLCICKQSNLVNNLGTRFLRPIASSSRENYGVWVLRCK